MDNRSNLRMIIYQGKYQGKYQNHVNFGQLHIFLFRYFPVILVFHQLQIRNRKYTSIQIHFGLFLSLFTQQLQVQHYVETQWLCRHCRDHGQRQCHRLLGSPNELKVQPFASHSPCSPTFQQKLEEQVHYLPHSEHYLQTIIRLIEVINNLPFPYFIIDKSIFRKSNGTYEVIPHNICRCIFSLNL